MLAFSNDYYGMIFRATQSVELFCAYSCQVLLAKKWGILIKKKPESLVFAGLEISRDYYILLEVSYGYTNDITYYFIVYF